MKKWISIGLFLLIFGMLNAQNSTALQIENFMVTQPVELNMPIYAQIEDLNGDVFDSEDLIKYAYLPQLNIRPQVGDELEWKDLNFLKWKKISASNEGIADIKASKKDFQLAYWVFYVQNDAWTQLEMDFVSGQMLEVFVDGKKQKGKYSFEKAKEGKSLKVELDLEANNHVVLVKSLFSTKDNDDWSLSCEMNSKNKENKVNITSGLDATMFMDINHLMNGVDIKSVELSATGDYYMISYKMTDEGGNSLSMIDVRNVNTRQTVQLFYGDEVFSLEWSPMGNKLTYMTKIGEKSWIWEYNLDNGQRFPIASDLESVYGYTWSPNGEFLILRSSEKPKDEKTGLKKLEGMADHWPWFRSRSNLIIYEVLSGIKTPLTHGYVSNNLEDISSDGRYILFSQGIIDYSQRPFGKQILMQYDRRTRQLDTIWNRFGNGSAEYSPDGKQLLVTAGPAFFGEIGTNLTKASIPNDYDSQAYLYTLADGSIKPISRDFNPSIESAYWNKVNLNEIYFKVVDRSYVNVYRYLIAEESFELLDLDVDVVNSFDFAKNKSLMVYSGSSISTPKKAFLRDLEAQNSVVLDYPEENFFKDVLFGKNEDWNFVNREGVTIEGRLYFPPNFDASKKYPLIVYYYGGTSPVERDFRGRYPKNLFAANGYMVFVLQPSGATGFGQDFSAEHVNNWGKTVAQEIIDGSRKVCESHSFIDSTKVGCMGASYGGFMTMYLTTQTDFFSAAISHAGISSISSYWGEGYWGYLYSEVASANSFPWNNRDLYVDQSPLFHADKVTTPILLLHGNSDTNVPTGESRQFYTALKLLNKDVELIEIDKQDHHILDYDKRILWQKTILAWFDKNLKGQSDWWFHIYPKKNL